MKRNKHRMTPTDHADSYRAYSKAIRIVSCTPMDDLRQKSRIVSYLYERGHENWIALNKLPISDFARAFDNSRATAA